LNLLFPLLAVWRWGGALDFCGLTLSRRRQFEVFLAAWPLSCLTPAKLGDLLKVVAFPNPREGGQALASLIVERLFDLPVLMFLSAVGFFCVFPNDRGPIGWGVLGLVVLAGIVWYGVWPFLRDKLLRARPTWAAVYDAFTFRSSPVIAGSSLLIWLLSVLQWQLVLMAFGIPAGFWGSLFRVPCCLLAGMVPLTWMGMGTRDGVFLWAYAGVAPPPKILAASLVFTTLRYLVPGVVGLPWTFVFLRDLKNRKMGAAEKG